MPDSQLGRAKPRRKRRQIAARKPLDVSKQEMSFLQTFMATGNLDYALQKSGIAMTKATAYRWIKEDAAKEALDNIRVARMDMAETLPIAVVHWKLRLLDPNTTNRDFNNLFKTGLEAIKPFMMEDKEEKPIEEMNVQELAQQIVMVENRLAARAKDVTPTPREEQIVTMFD